MYEKGKADESICKSHGLRENDINKKCSKGRNEIFGTFLFISWERPCCFKGR